jgi:hypothetical protein
MKLALALFALLEIGTASAQVDFPSNPTVGPKKYEKRSVGGEIDAGAKVEEKQGTVRYTTHIVLYDTRIWTSIEGKPLSGKLIAFEDLTAEAPKGTSEPKMSAPPAKPTVVRDGKVRLLVDRKPVEISLKRLSTQDIEFIGQIEAAIEKKAAAGN